MMARWWIGLSMMLLLAACDEVTPEGYVELVEGARACTADADCVLAGSSMCTCDAPIEASRRQEIEAAALEVECQGVGTTNCPAHTNLRCEALRCVTDESP
jgi:hypothetical protein